MSPIKNVLIPTKGDDVGEDAFRLACGICKENKAKLYALYVIEVKQELPLDAEVDPRLGENILGRIEALALKRNALSRLNTSKPDTPARP